MVKLGTRQDERRRLNRELQDARLALHIRHVDQRDSLIRRQRIEADELQDDFDGRRITLQALYGGEVVDARVDR